MGGTPSSVSMFQIPQTPRTGTGQNTPKKFKSPNSQMMEDVTASLQNLNTAMTSPARDGLDITINPQSKNNKRREKPQQFL